MHPSALLIDDHHGFIVTIQDIRLGEAPPSAAGQDSHTGVTLPVTAVPVITWQSDEVVSI